jgi:histidine ammonia-lyase
MTTFNYSCEFMQRTLRSNSMTLHGHGVTVADVEAVARGGVQVVLSNEARARVVAARAVVDRLVRSGGPVYGVTTALGANTGAAIPVDDLAAYQQRAVRARAVGLGPSFARDVVRAILFARICGMAVGGSGVSPAVLDALLAMLNAGVHPVVPSKGSIGAADLASLSHLALPLFGEGLAEYKGTIFTGAEAFSLAGLEHATLAAKDGLALISSNAATAGHAALVLVDCARAVDRLNAAAALSFEGFRASLSPLDARIQAARPLPASYCAKRYHARRRHTHEPARHGACRSVSLRCVTQVHGAAISAPWNARDATSGAQCRAAVTAGAGRPKRSVEGKPLCRTRAPAGWVSGWRKPHCFACSAANACAAGDGSATTAHPARARPRASRPPEDADGALQRNPPLASRDAR